MLADADDFFFLGFLAGFDASPEAFADAEAFAEADAAVAVGTNTIDAEDMTNPATNDVNTVKNFLFMVRLLVLKKEMRWKYGKLNLLSKLQNNFCHVDIKHDVTLLVN